ncbi:hypothetical protein EDC04DRAFT_2611136 [Pisolithus marmoratus]|nr:hypothetical protein EDC04DRAFT_2611136 [Pisolithus marmoratus]
MAEADEAHSAAAEQEEGLHDQLTKIMNLVQQNHACCEENKPVNKEHCAEKQHWKTERDAYNQRQHEELINAIHATANERLFKFQLLSLSSPHSMLRSKHMKKTAQCDLDGMGDTSVPSSSHEQTALTLQRMRWTTASQGGVVTQLEKVGDVLAQPQQTPRQQVALLDNAPQNILALMPCHQRRVPQKGQKVHQTAQATVPQAQGQTTTSQLTACNTINALTLMPMLATTQHTSQQPWHMTLSTVPEAPSTSSAPDPSMPWAAAAGPTADSGLLKKSAEKISSKPSQAGQQVVCEGAGGHANNDRMSESGPDENRLTFPSDDEEFNNHSNFYLNLEEEMDAGPPCDLNDEVGLEDQMGTPPSPQQYPLPPHSTGQQQESIASHQPILPQGHRVWNGPPPHNDEQYTHTIKRLVWTMMLIEIKKATICIVPFEYCLYPPENIEDNAEWIEFIKKKATQLLEDSLGRASNFAHPALKKICLAVYYCTSSKSLCQFIEFQASVPDKALALVRTILMMFKKHGAIKNESLCREEVEDAYNSLTSLIGQVWHDSYHGNKFDTMLQEWAWAGMMGYSTREAAWSQTDEWQVVLD